jgi:hypothetical protein
LGKPLSMAIQYATYAFVGRYPGKRLSEITSKAFAVGYFLVAEKMDNAVSDDGT